MYRIVGFLVVAGFALFGVSKFIEDHVVLGKDDADEPGHSAGEAKPQTAPPIS